MKKEDKVISLDLAKKLHELGVKAESEYVWFDVKFPTKPNEILLCRNDKIECTNDFVSFESWHAYDTAELWEFMPRDIMLGKFIAEYFCWKAYKHSCYAVNMEITDYYLAELLGKMLVWLIENGYVKGEEL